MDLKKKKKQTRQTHLWVAIKTAVFEFKERDITNVTPINKIISTEESWLWGFIYLLFLQCWKMQIAAVAPLQHDHPLPVLTDFLKDSAHKMSGFFCSAFRNFPLLKHLPLLRCLGPSQPSGNLLSQEFLTIWALKCHECRPFLGKWWQLPSL